MTNETKIVTDTKNDTKINPNPKKKKSFGKIAIVLCRISLFALAILGASSAIAAITNVSSSIVAASMGTGMLLLSTFFISIEK